MFANLVGRFEYQPRYQHQQKRRLLLQDHPHTHRPLALSPITLEIPLNTRMALLPLLTHCLSFSSD
ncbi:hypothetical protein EI94DRAFT_1276081 [Lactarius quietus]|nr:hypothetical protein EI94DRAFT_1276081 [Lactarius quietus]